jgi:hypothetical protein
MLVLIPVEVAERKQELQDWMSVLLSSGAGVPVCKSPSQARAF